MGFRGAMRGLGNALTYIGQQGVEAQQQEARDQRLMQREQALLTLREQMSEARAMRTEERELKNYARQTPLVAQRRGAELRAAEPYAIANDERTASLSEARDERTAHRQEQAAIRAERRALAREERAQDREALRAGRRVRSRDVDEQGHRIITYEDGTSWRSEYRVRSGSGDGGNDWEDDGSSGGSGGGGGVRSGNIRMSREEFSQLQRAAHSVSIGTVMEGPDGSTWTVERVGNRRELRRTD